MIVSADPTELGRCAGLVVPGVGAFAACMDGLTAVGGDDLIRDWVAGQRPLLGICVGHQVLFSRGAEHGIEVAGVGLLDGAVTGLRAERLPHMGWNTVSAPEGSRLFAGVRDERFYFVHSYAATAAIPGAVTTFAAHEGVPFVAAVEAGPVSSTQFHPEKSGAAGARLISNWLATVAGQRFG